MTSSSISLPSLDRAWTVYLVHHAHTDVGYTDVQCRIARRHAGFVDQALDIARRAESGDTGLRGFVWTSECFWSIEQWLRATPLSRHGELAAAIHSGAFGLSGTYLHFTELVDDRTVRRMLGKAADYAVSIQARLDTAVSADINGFSWGYAQALFDTGIQNLVVCLHAHHGLAPIGVRQRPFWWLTPGGDKIFVWLGEHYMLGNILGLAPGAVLNYAFTDELQPKPATTDNWAVAEARLSRYLNQLATDGYPASFVPIHIAGVLTDNSPPGEEVARFVNAWNARHGSQIRLEFTTPSALCARARLAFPSVPEYRGDWPDWWSDGVVSTPAATRLCRQAQRDYRYLRALAGTFNLPIDRESQNSIEESIALYTEHTFSHSASVHVPWALACQAITAGKTAYAASAYHHVSAALASAFCSLGEVPDASVGRPLNYRVVNPLAIAVRDVARLPLESHDLMLADLVATVVDRSTGRIVPHQKTPSLRGFTLDVRLDLAPGAKANLEICPGAPTLPHARRHSCDFGEALDVVGSEQPSSLSATTRVLESPSVRLEFDSDRGITTWIDKTAGRSLLHPNANHAPFQPIYDVTPVNPRHDHSPLMMRNENIMTRNRLGRNRKGAEARHSAGRLEQVTVLELGALRAAVQLDYAIAGCTMFRVVLRTWVDLPRVDVSVQVIKQTVWEPENLYLALPFTADGPAACELWIEKAGALVRPWRDQLPDSLTDFYCLQDGLAFLDGEQGVAIATPDAPLIQLGELSHGQRHLMGSPSLSSRPLLPYSWLMSNFWETNFEANLGGFHEFNYRIEWGAHIRTPSQAIDLCRALNHGITCFRSVE